MRANVLERNDNPRWVNFVLDHINGSRHSYSKAKCLKEYLHSEPNKEINRLENPRWVKFVLHVLEKQPKEKERQIYPCQKVFSLCRTLR